MAKGTKKAPTKKTETAEQAVLDERATEDAQRATAKRKVEEQFAEADAKGDPAVEEATLSRQVRGW
jgi:hypothetical protein